MFATPATASRRTRALVGALVVAALGLSIPGRASAAGLVVIPHPAANRTLSYFKLGLRPGRAAQAGAIELLNRSPRRLRIALVPVDGQTLSTLGSSYASAGSRPHRSARWLRLAQSRVTLSPGASTMVPVTVAAPASAKPGDYLSGVSIEAMGQGSSKAKRHGVSIASAVRYVIGAEVSLPGPRRPSITFTGARLQRQPAGLTFLLQARNSGNAILQGVYGRARVSRAGRTVASLAIRPGTFVTGTAIEYPVPAHREAPAEGTRYRVQAWMRYRGGIARLDTTVTFGHRDAVLQTHYRQGPGSSGGTAWWKIAGLVALVVYGLATTLLLLRRRRRSRDGGGPPPGARGLAPHLDSDQESQPV